MVSGNWSEFIFLTAVFRIEAYKLARLGAVKEKNVKIPIIHACAKNVADVIQTIAFITVVARKGINRGPRKRANSVAFFCVP